MFYFFCCCLLCFSSLFFLVFLWGFCGSWFYKESQAFLKSWFCFLLIYFTRLLCKTLHIWDRKKKKKKKIFSDNGDISELEAQRFIVCYSFFWSLTTAGHEEFRHKNLHVCMCVYIYYRKQVFGLVFLWWA